MVRKNIFIPLTHEIDRFRFEQVLKILADHFKPEKIEFVGYLESFKVINLNGDNYKVRILKDMIKLAMTTDKRVKVPSYQLKIEAAERYTLFLKNIYENK